MFRQRWYLVARNLPYDAIRTYSLDRIQAILTTDTPFKLPANLYHSSPEAID
ncbi:MAG: WYL domain-containing protein [Tannerellaceae bacterium]|nr:WYL domain-containing protein [Tannerellaceae bacterium]